MEELSICKRSDGMDGGSVEEAAERPCNAGLNTWVHVALRGRREDIVNDYYMAYFFIPYSIHTKQQIKAAVYREKE